MTKHNWKQILNNTILEGKDFYISYNPNTSNGHSEITRIANALGTFTGDTFKDGEETALCKDSKFYILDGDHRKEYEKVFDKGFDECFKYFKSKPDLLNNWTTRD